MPAQANRSARPQAAAPRKGAAAVARRLAGGGRLRWDLAAATLVAAALGVVPALLIELLLGRVLPARAGASLLLVGLLLAVVAALQAWITIARAQLAARLALRGTAPLGTALFEALLASPPTPAGAQQAGAAREGLAALDSLQADIADATPRLMLSTGTAVLALPLMAYIDAELTLAVLAIGGVAAAILLAGARGLAAAAADEAAGADARDALVRETLAARPTLQALGVAPARLAGWMAPAGRQAGAQRAVLARGATRRGLAVALAHGLPLVALMLGIALPFGRGEAMMVAPLLAYVLLLVQVLAPLPEAVALAENRAAVRHALARIAAVPPGPADPAADAPPLEGGLAFENVTAHYPGRDRPALQALCFTAPPGAITAVAGPVGAGKSTVGRLLAGTLAPTAGTLRIGGEDLATVAPLRQSRSVVVVPSRSPLLPGTVREVIAAGRPDVPYGAVVAAAALAGADGFIERLPRGFDTPLDEGAPQLSCGQRQRLALARAVLLAPPVLVLDGAMSALDGDAETAILARLRAARPDGVTLLMSTRPTTLAACDAVLFLGEGTPGTAPAIAGVDGPAGTRPALAPA